MYVSRNWDRHRFVLTKLPPFQTPMRNTLDIYTVYVAHTHECTAHTAHYMSLPVVRDITEQFYAAWHHLAENKSIFNNYDDGEAKRNSLKAAGKSLLGGAENTDNADPSSSQKILGGGLR